MTMAIVSSSGTSSPRAMKPRASSPSGVPSRSASRKRLPLATWGRASSRDRIVAWVPLPAPTAPTSRTICRPRAPVASPGDVTA